MNTIAFVLTSLNDTHMLKRVDEFVKQGYDIRVYGFSRSNNINSAYDLPIKEIGKMPEKRYLYRLFFMFKAMRDLRKELPENTLMYYFGQDIAMIGRLVFHRPFFYEESDLSFTYVKNRLIQKILHFIDRNIIRCSIRTILTSEGFCRFHFPVCRPENISIIPNRLDPKCQLIPFIKVSNPDIHNFRLGYVGIMRFRSTLKFFQYAATIPKNSLSFFGVEHWFSSDYERQFKELCNEGKVKCYGSFKNPEDLSDIYSKIDLTIATYDVEKLNPRWAEPNKLYEAIYYETPIVVSSNCYLADVVQEMNVGFVVDTDSEESLKSFFETLTYESIQDKRLSCSKLGHKFCLNDNTKFFNIIQDILSNY